MTRSFPGNIKWIGPESIDHFYADPFLLGSDDGYNNILFEDFSIEENYGNISLLTVDNDFNTIKKKVLLDTHSHLSFPFIYSEMNRIFVFPESVRAGSVSCYEYDRENKSLFYLQKVLELPLYDSVILKYNNRYWLFGTLFEKRLDYKLNIFYSDNLLGPYIPHKGNPVKSGLNGTRAAGNFFEVDRVIYRPVQNCEREYGESITINKLIKLDESSFIEEPSMEISIDDANLKYQNIHTIHTINILNDLIVIDGMRWTFSLKEQWKNFLRNRKLLRQMKYPG